MDSKSKTVTTSTSEQTKAEGNTTKTGVLLDLEELRLSQNYTESLGVKKALLTVPVRKPGRQDFVRVRPGTDWYIETGVLELKEERETYLVDPALWPELPGEITM